MSDVVQVIDGDPHFVAYIKGVFESALIECHTYQTVAEFEQSSCEGNNYCLILDLALQNDSGFNLIRKLNSRESFLTPIIVLTGSGSIGAAVKCIQLGAFDVLEKPCSPDRLTRTVIEAFELSAARRKERLEELRAQGLIRSLTEREKDVVKLICSGSSSKQIAKKLQISINTVGNHRASALAKLKAGSLAELMQTAYLGRLATLGQDHSRPVAESIREPE